MREDLWIIAYGNPDRKDDGCGWHVAERLRSSLRRGGVTIRTMHQLDPTLAEDLGEARRIVFVDAAVRGYVKEGSRWERLMPEAGSLPLVTHHIEPSFLLRLVTAAWGRCPEAWLVTVEGEDFDMGEGLSPLAQRGVEEACKEIVSFAAGE